MSGTKLKVSSKPFVPRYTKVSPSAKPKGLKARGSSKQNTTVDSIKQRQNKLFQQISEEVDEIIDVYVNKPASITIDYTRFGQLLEQYKTLTGKLPSERSFYDFCPQYMGKFLLNGGKISEETTANDLCFFLTRERWLSGPFLEAIKYNTHSRELFLNKVCYAKLYIKVRESGYIDHRMEHGLILFQRLWRKYREKGEKVTLEELDQLHDRSEQKDHLLHLSPSVLREKLSLLEDCEDESRLLRWHGKHIMALIREQNKIYAGWEPPMYNGLLDSYLGVDMMSHHEQLKALFLQSYQWVFKNDDAIIKVASLIREVGVGKNIEIDPHVRRYKFCTLSFDHDNYENDKSTTVDFIKNAPLYLLQHVLPIVSDFLGMTGQNIIKRLRGAKFETMAQAQLIEWYLNTMLSYFSYICAREKLPVEPMFTLLTRGKLPKSQKNIEKTLMDHVKQHLMNLRDKSRAGEPIGNLGYMDFSVVNY